LRSAVGYLQETEQSHQNAVTAGTPADDYAHDTDVVSSVYADGLRLETVTILVRAQRVVYTGYRVGKGRKRGHSTFLDVGVGHG
jgi:hypothetical protein